ncbi:alpha/beta fold hydrolase [Steroidobacter sp.]|uniref:alpha/beta fold hydrolase n=1 Tax=Steroidobacter sp. TaxID=1978227 RepID=UPI001A44C20A|nr:alpha/beta hydrolase [Steroidobacter sp.]MBL8266437.1 alpha/beta hydrolase [Steroidobacter sp.]
MHKTANRIITWLCACASLLFAVATASSAPAYRDEMVNVRGTLMHFRVYPGDARTVLMEAGSGEGHERWNELAPRILATTGATVISYDRAGFGSSEPLTTPYDIHDEVSRLHAGLYALGRDQWLVLVGHSYGGYLIQLYSNLYPGDVRGLVYVDADTVQSIDAVDAAAMVVKSIKAKERLDASPTERASLRHARAFVATHETMRRYPVVCNVPVSVLTADIVWPDGSKAEREGWVEGHRQLALASNGRWIVAKGAGHMLQVDRPDIVLETLHQVLADVPRRGASLGVVGQACAKPPR